MVYTNSIKFTISYKIICIIIYRMFNTEYSKVTFCTTHCISISPLIHIMVVRHGDRQGTLVRVVNVVVTGLVFTGLQPLSFLKNQNYT